MALVGFGASAVWALAYQNGDYMGSLNKKASGAQCFIMTSGLFWDIVTGLPWTPNGVVSLEPKEYCIFLPGAHYLTINSPYGADSSLNKLLLLLLTQSERCVNAQWTQNTCRPHYVWTLRGRRAITGQARSRNSQDAVEHRHDADQTHTEPGSASGSVCVLVCVQSVFYCVWVNAAWTLRELCVKAAGTLRGSCVNAAWTLRERCVNAAWTLRERYVRFDFLESERTVYYHWCPGYVVLNATVNITIPTVDGINQTIPVISVNNWIIFQQRIDGTMSMDYKWSVYQAGFGNYSHNFWMGLERIHQMTFGKQCRMRIEMFNDLNQWLSFEYNSFFLDNNGANYTIHIAGYSGDLVQDLMIVSSMRVNGMQFSTRDADNDADPTQDCATKYGGGWWWNACHAICLNGKYGSRNGIYPAFGYKDVNQNQTAGVIWRDLTISRMMVKCTWSD